MTLTLKTINFLNLPFITPTFIINENKILIYFEFLKDLRNDLSVNLLFPLKSFSILPVLESFAYELDGLSTSSIFEARLARRVLTSDQLIHITTPGIRPDQFDEMLEICDYTSFNSLPQLDYFSDNIRGRTSCGLRINPQLSFVEDFKYDPCRINSKLGVPLKQLASIYKEDFKLIRGIEGILIHSNCESQDFNELSQTISHIEKELPEILNNIKWINLGGGYLFESEEDLAPLKEIISYLNNQYGLEVFFEPGKAIVGRAGYIVSTILDIFESDNKEIAVLDTTVNHMPEVFEYQYKPEVMNEVENGKCNYILAGCTCLADDVFGEYSFAEPLEIGSRIVFEDVGAYTLVKAHMFNGVNLPDIYVLKTNGDLEFVKRFTFEDYISRCGGEINDSKRKAANYSY